MPAERPRPEPPEQPWFAQYYREHYAASVRGFLTPARTRAEVDFLLRETGLEPPARVLDAPCGWGRHSLELARRGFSVVGVDLNAEFVAEARAAAEPGMDVEFLAQDAREAVAGPFDAVFCLYHSFGFLDDEENERLVGSWAALLRPGGWFAIDVWNRDLIVRQFEPERVWDAGTVEVAERRSFDAISGRIRVDYEYRYPGGRAERVHADMRLYTAAELRRLLERAGLRVTSVYGSLVGEPYGVDSARLVLFGHWPQS